MTSKIDTTKTELKTQIKWLCAEDAHALGLRQRSYMSWTIGRCDGACEDRCIVSEIHNFIGVPNVPN